MRIPEIDRKWCSLLTDLSLQIFLKTTFLLMLIPTEAAT